MSTSKQIFVSHSQHDEDMRVSFDTAFARTGVISKCMEFENMEPPQWEKISKEIQNSEATFLLLGPNVKRSEHTQNWIAFEVGLSCAFNKRVWVFEQTSSTVDFPIPYVTDYMFYENLEDKDYFNYVRSIIEGYRFKSLVHWAESKEIRHEIPQGKSIKCPRCQSKFALHAIRSILFYCPSCRHQIRF